EDRRCPGEVLVRSLVVLGRGDAVPKPEALNRTPEPIEERPAPDQVAQGIEPMPGEQIDPALMAVVNPEASLLRGACDDPARLGQEAARPLEISFRRTEMSEVEARSELPFGLVDLIQVLPGLAEIGLGFGRAAAEIFEHADVVGQHGAKV